MNIFWAHIIRMLLTIQMNSFHISPMKNRRRHVTNLPKNEMRQHHKVWGLLFSLQHFTIEHEKSKKFTNSNCYFISNKVRTFINKTCSHSFVYCWCIALAKEFNILYQFGIPTMLLSVKWNMNRMVENGEREIGNNDSVCWMSIICKLK